MLRLALASMLAAAVLAGCADQPAPDASAPGFGPSFANGVTKASLEQQIRALYPPPARPVPIGMLVAINQAVIRGETAAARAVMFELVDLTLRSFYDGLLIGGESPATQQKVLKLVHDLYLFVGLTPPDLSPGALGPDAATAVVTPTSPTTNIVTETEFAGVQVPSGAVSQTTIISLVRIPDTFSPTFGPLNTDLDQYPLYYQYTASPAVTLNQDVVVGICDVEPGPFVAPPGADLRVAHNVGSGIEILPLAAVPFNLDCSDADVSLASAAPRGFPALAMAGWKGVTRRMAPVFRSVFLPEMLQAATLGTSGLGGTTRNFSPFGRVDLLSLSQSYRFLIGAAGHTAGFQSPSFVEGAGWQTGTAPFGSGGSCPLDPTVATNWPIGSNEAPSDLLLRKFIDLPSDFVQDLEIDVAIDNDVQVWVNGVDISGGLKVHENCAAFDEPGFIFTAPNGILQAGRNLLAVRARDRGVISFVDLKITAVSPESEE